METNRIILGDCLEVMREMLPKSVDLVIGSPPYAGKGERYGTDWKWGTREWVDWMKQVTIASVRISKNVVVWVANGYVKNGRYEPACEGLVWELHEYGIRCERPAIWHKNSAPTKRPWFGNDWEFCLAFRPNDSIEYFDWESIATPPKYKSGGRFRQRTREGARRNGGFYPTGKLARPRDVLRATVGGGHMGSNLASLNEAPFPEKIVEPFVKSLCPPGGITLDPFSGSGTVPAVCEKHGRRWLGIDIRESQIELGNRRLEEVRGIVPLYEKGAA